MEEKEIKICSIKNLSEECVGAYDNGLTTAKLGKEAGSKKLYVNIDIVAKNAYSTKYHSHTLQEEFFYIAEGKGVLRINNTEKDILKGEFFAKIAGENIAHTFYNPYDENLVILDVGTVEKGDICYYPDDKAYMIDLLGQKKFVKEKDFDESYDNTPKEKADIE